MAEMENLRRRTERDKSEFAKYAISEFARDVVGVGDNIRRAIEAVPKESVCADPALRSLIEGIEVTERELLKVLEKFQVKRFDPLGEPFNPHLHDAMTKIDVPNVPADTVVQVIHAGYMIDERVLRPAAVIVAKGSARASSIPRNPYDAPQGGRAVAARRDEGSGRGGHLSPDLDAAGAGARRPSGRPAERAGTRLSGGTAPAAWWPAARRVQRVTNFRRSRGQQAAIRRAMTAARKTAMGPSPPTCISRSSAPATSSRSAPFSNVRRLLRVLRLMHENPASGRWRIPASAPDSAAC